MQKRFDAFLSSPLTVTAYHAIFLAATAIIVADSVRSGIETAAKILMPILAILMVALALYAIIEGDIATALNFLFKLDTEHLNANVALEALGLGMFSIGIGLGLMITFAFYAHVCFGPIAVMLNAKSILIMTSD
ncbi:MAG: hypothetical protein ACR2PH_10390 [Desulfobulbia bacterium]